MNCLPLIKTAMHEPLYTSAILIHPLKENGKLRLIVT
jgi:hypothetical protein